MCLLMLVNVVLLPCQDKAEGGPAWGTMADSMAGEGDQVGDKPGGQTELE